MAPTSAPTPAKWVYTCIYSPMNCHNRNCVSAEERSFVRDICRNTPCTSAYSSTITLKAVITVQSTVWDSVIMAGRWWRRLTYTAAAAAPTLLTWGSGRSSTSRAHPCLMATACERHSPFATRLHLEDHRNLRQDEKFQSVLSWSTLENNLVTSRSHR